MIQIILLKVATFKFDTLTFNDLHNKYWSDA